MIGFTSHAMWMAFISFSCLIAVARIFNAMLNANGKSEHSCFVPDFRGSLFNFSFLSIILAVALLYMAFIMLRYIPSILILLSFFNHK